MSWTDYSQNTRIRELEEALDSAHARIAHERRHLRSELSQVRGNLEKRLDRVSATLDAFIELSDVRETLSLFGDAARARHRTLQMLDGAAVPDLRLEDVPDYWLVPAAHGLHALRAGDTATARVRFDDAARRDADRGRAFAALATALTHAEHARAIGASLTADLLPHLPLPSEELDRGRRALWLLTADGSFGDEAREHLLLSTLRHWSAEGVRPTGFSGLGAAPPSAKRGAARGRLPAGVAERVAAARRLTGLREDIARITALGSEEASARALAPDRVSADFLWESLRLLVEEGSPEEAPLLARAGELRGVIEGDASGQQAWDDRVGTVEALLDEDMVRDEAPPHRRTFALVLQRPAVLDAAETLLGEATAPVEDRSTVPVRGTRVAITSRGADAQDLADLDARLEREHDSASTPSFLGPTGLGLTALLVVAALVTSSGVLWLLCLASALATAAVFVTNRGRGRNEEERRAGQKRARTQVDAAVASWRAALAEAEGASATAREEAGRIRSLLNPS
ncbi:hypothetical protein [Nocardiopsis sp. NRRL B-16309]|uniref:hypothetical protein n=1 Tax=Nocardiopsis sp. NRRL B-16309 TaxID=1519494 RepID=UPI0006B02483|nr:hypothetical protein [Nocardiopsis sp. NRRL B-16309]KOX13369.1 hypothetical protein ADL05_19185 [Nocardiopsis sp. NRRL B-16309]